MEKEICFYEVTGYPSYFSGGMPRRKINEKQIRLAIARVLEKEAERVNKKQFSFDEAQIELKNHVAFFSTTEGKKERVHYRITQYSPGSPYPWYSIGKNKLDELKEDGVEKMLCLYFDSSGEVKGSMFDVYYSVVLLTEVETDSDTWKVENKNHGVLYRWNPTSSYKSCMNKIEKVVAKGERGEEHETGKE